MSKRVSIRGQFRAVDTAPAYAFIGGGESKLCDNVNTAAANSSNVISNPAEIGLDNANVYRIYDIVSNICGSNQAVTESALEAALVEIRLQPLSQHIQEHLEIQLSEFAAATDDRSRNWHALGLFSYLQGIIDCVDALSAPAKES